MKHLISLLLLLAGFNLSAQIPDRLSDAAQISLMTVEPGPYLYSAFGHSAIRVFDPVNRVDRCYNYGTFQFDQKGFYLKFIRGKLLYFIDVESYKSFEYYNLYDNRTMQEQTLNLTHEQKERLYHLLIENTKEENKYYKYDFFYDNCATRIRDIVSNTYFHHIEYDSSMLEQKRTMRQLLHPYLESKPWVKYGIDLVLGMPADKVALAEQYMFLPDYVHHMFAGTRTPDGAPLVLNERRIPDAPKRTSQKPSGFLSNPLWVMILIAVLGVLSLLHPRAARIFDMIFWLLLGLGGFLVAFLWFGTDHSPTKMNWNILWLLPTHLLFFWRNRKDEWVDNYFMGAGMLAGLYLLLWMIIPQQFPVEAIPIVVLVVIKGLKLGNRVFRPLGF